MSQPALPQTLGLVLALLLCVTVAQAQEFVWRIPGNAGHDVYLIGSVHLLPPHAYPLSPAFDRAYQASELLMFETDLGALQTPATQFQLLADASYPPGQSLSATLTPQLFAKLQKSIDPVGLPQAALEGFKPWFVATMIELTAFTKAGFRPELGIDSHFYERALSDKKAVFGLEQLDTHLAVLTDMSTAQSAAYLQDTLENLEILDDAPSELYEFWRNGDAPGLAAYVEEQVHANPALYARLVDDRNHSWLEDIKALLNGNVDAMVVVGALHLVGDQGLPALLAKQGYAPEQF